MKDVYAIYEPKNDGQGPSPVGQGRRSIPQPRWLTERSPGRAASQWPSSDS